VKRTCGALKLAALEQRWGEFSTGPAWAGMTAARQRLGHAAEELAARRLADSGWEIVARNARTRFGELDLIARDDQALVFVEVKAGRQGAAFGPPRPVLAVDRRKQLRIRRLAGAWLASHRPLPPHREIRFDAIGITFDHTGHVLDYEHLEGAF
jgi:putative endonuclease